MGVIKATNGKIYVGGPLSSGELNGTGISIDSTSGNVGIGTTTPLSKLDVNGGVAIGTYAGSIAAPSNGLVVSGSVGVGTAVPSAIFSVAGDSASNLILANFTNTNSGASADARVDIHSTGTGGDPYLQFAVINSTAWSMGIDNSDSDKFKITDQADLQANFMFVIDTSGNVQITGNCSDAPGGGGCTPDYAEVYQRDPSDMMEKTDLLALNPATGKVTRADATHQELIGIFSSSPGSLIGQRKSSIQLGVGKGVMDDLGPDEIPVALSGRVPVKVSTESGPIKIGDRITVSSLPGVGMKATVSGETVGIALEPFDGSSATTTGALPDGTTVSTGKILVFVNLGYAKLDDVVTELGTKSAALGTGSTSPSSSNLAPSSVNAWSVNQTSGKVNVNFFGDVSLNGNAIINVSKIIGMWGKWTIDENGVITAAKVIADEVSAQSLEVGSAPKPNGITLYDPGGLPYCVRVRKGGALASETGACGSPSLTAGGSQPTSNQSSQNADGTGQATNPPMPSASEGAATATTTDNVQPTPNQTASAGGTVQATDSLQQTTATTTEATSTAP